MSSRRRLAPKRLHDGCVTQPPQVPGSAQLPCGPVHRCRYGSTAELSRQLSEQSSLLRAQDAELAAARAELRRRDDAEHRERPSAVEVGAVEVGAVEVGTVEMDRLSNYPGKKPAQTVLNAPTDGEIDLEEMSAVEREDAAAAHEGMVAAREGAGAGQVGIGLNRTENCFRHPAGVAAGLTGRLTLSTARAQAGQTQDCDDAVQEADTNDGAAAGAVWEIRV